MELRGKKSWGWTDGDEIVKSLGAISDGWNYSFGHEAYRTAALHTRQPTTGSVVADNSHPFKIGEIVGMHNGIVHNHAELQTKYSRNCAVDSEHIFHHINEGKSLSDIRAYGAIVYWKDGVVHIGRFNNGDMCIARTDIAWVFASTKAAVQESLRFAGLGKNAIYMQLKEGRLYKLVGDQIELAGDLDFGDYSKSFGTWQTANTTVGPHVTRYNHYPTSYGYNGIDDSDDFAYGYRGAVTIPPTKGLALPATTQSVIEATTTRTPAINVISQMVESAINKAREVNQSIVEVSVEEEPTKWNCFLCTGSIDGKYHVIDNSEFICDTCSLGCQDRVLNSVDLTQLPIDKTNLSQMTNMERDSDGYLSCDACTNYFITNDSIFITAFSDFMCLDCFISGEGEQEIEDDAEYTETMTPIENDTGFYDDYEDDEIKIELLESKSIRVTHKKTGTVVEYPKGTEPETFLQEL